jgi:hypothetical protein
MAVAVAVVVDVVVDVAVVVVVAVAVVEMWWLHGTTQEAPRTAAGRWCSIRASLFLGFSFLCAATE